MKAADYSEISIEVFLNMTGELPFDVYVQLSPDKFTKVFNRRDKVDKERFSNYAQKGAQTLYILRKDRRDYMGATERFVKKLIHTPNAPMSAMVKAVEELTEHSLFEIFEDKIFDEDSLRRATDIAKTQVNLLKTDPKMLTQFLHLSRHESYLIRHSISTSVLGILIARANANMNERMLNIIAMGGLLHDIGMAMLPPEISDVDRRLSTEEWKMVRTHPLHGGQMVGQIKNFPPEVALVIEQHHESYDGTGYPKGVSGDQIYYPARVIALADSFSALTTRRGGRALYPPEDALALLKTEDGKYDPKILEAFDQMLHPGKKAA